MKISFDFDSTLTEDYIQEIAKSFIKAGNDVHIVTSRCTVYYSKTPNKDLFEVADNLGISREKIHFTEGDFKLQTLKLHKFDLHFDDMEDEVLNCNQGGVNAFLVGLKDFSKLNYLFKENT